MTLIGEIEGALVGLWSLFGRWPRGSLHEERGLLWYETPIEHLPYNGVIRTHLSEADADEEIARLIRRFRGREVDFMWLVHPTATPADLGERLAAHGLARVETASGMSLDLDRRTPAAPPEGISYEEVLDQDGLEEYTALTLGYWEIERAADAELVAEIHRYWGPGRVGGHRYLARLDGVAVGKAFLSLDGPDGVASIFGMNVAPRARGRGIARGLTAALLERAVEHGCRRVVLHSTELARGLYGGIGFVERCRIDVFATASIWSSGHGAVSDEEADD